MTSPETLLPTIKITRVFKAPRDVVFSMFTNEDHLKHWWGPAGFTSPDTKVDVRVNGIVWLDMIGPDGVRIENRGEFMEIEAPSRLVFALRALPDAEGLPQLETINTFTFTETNGQTTMDMTAVVTKAAPGAAEGVRGMNTGWNESLDKLQRLVVEAEGASK